LTDQFAGAFPVWGQLVNPVNAMIFGGRKQDLFAGGFNLPPGLSIIEDLMKAGYQVAAEDDRGKGLFDNKGFLSSLDALAQASGVPGYIQAKRTYKGINEFEKKDDWRYLIWSKTQLEPQGVPRGERPWGE